MIVDGTATCPGPRKGCGWRRARPARRVRVPLARAGLRLALVGPGGLHRVQRRRGHGDARDAERTVPLQKGLNQVVFQLTGKGDALGFHDLSSGTVLCVGDAQVGNPAPAPAP